MSERTEQFTQELAYCTPLDSGGQYFPVLEKRNTPPLSAIKATL